jgi:sigma-B regulation protein RsbU (phosphoserine phosphatase)
MLKLSKNPARAPLRLPDISLPEVGLDHERLTRELKLAEQVQQRFLPQALPEVPGYEFFAFYHAAHEVGGDYYDFVPMPESRLGIALGDVSGKGVAAALLMAKFSSDTRHELQAEGSPEGAATVLNKTLCATGIDERFITLSLSILVVSTGRLLLCSAGHPSVLLRRSDGTVEKPGDETAGLPLGVLPDAEYQQVEIELRTGDVLVVYSDGVTDARSPSEELYDTRENRRLLKRVEATEGGPRAVGKAILREIHEFSRGHSQADDITLVCFGPTKGEPARTRPLLPIG